MENKNLIYTETILNNYIAGKVVRMMPNLPSKLVNKGLASLAVFNGVKNIEIRLVEAMAVLVNIKKRLLESCRGKAIAKGEATQVALNSSGMDNLGKHIKGAVHSTLDSHNGTHKKIMH